MPEAKCSKCNSLTPVEVKCPGCDEKALFDDSLFCTKCGKQLAYFQRGCTNSGCVRMVAEFKFALNEHYCDMCGNPVRLVP